MNTRSKKVLAATMMSFLFFVGAQTGQAAIVSMETENAINAVNDIFSVEVFVDPEGVSVNTLGGSLTFPVETLLLKEVRKGGSIVSFWIEDPSSFDPTAGRIDFSGIVPGGFDAASNLFAILFESRGAGDVELVLQNLELYPNDGTGVALPVRSDQLNLIISAHAAPDGPVTEDDTSVPEVFVPVVLRQKDFYDGKATLIFSTQDKGVGVSHYFVQEGAGERVRTESPYVLQDQRIREPVFVTAVDFNGNERIATVQPDAQGTNTYSYVAIPVIISIILLGLFTFFKKRSTQ